MYENHLKHPVDDVPMSITTKRKSSNQQSNRICTSTQTKVLCMNTDEANSPSTTLKCIKYSVPTSAKSASRKNGQVSNQVNSTRHVQLERTATPVVSAPKTYIDTTKLVRKPLKTIDGVAFESEEKTGGEEEPIASFVPGTSIFQKGTFYTIAKSDSIRSSRSNPPLRQSDRAPRVVYMSTTQRNLRPARGRPRGSRSKLLEPECLTIFSDDDEPPAESDTNSSNNSSPVILKQKGHNNNSIVHSGEVRNLRDCYEEKMDVDEQEVLEDDEEVVEEEEEQSEPSSEVKEKERVSVYKIDNGSNPRANCVSGPKHQILYCRSVRIGSYKIHPTEKPHIPVYVDPDGLEFQVPAIENANEKVDVALKRSDILTVMGHFGRCLPIMFIFCTRPCGERIRNLLDMTLGTMPCFDPDGQDDRQKVITLLIDSINDDLRTYLRNVFPGEEFLKEVDQKIANEVLVKSTPQQQQVATQAVVLRPVSVSPVIQVTIPVGSSIVTQVVPVQIVPLPFPQPLVKKIMTYPPPPETGGIAITSDDLLCLDEEEFLNDAIIDFYLKYLMLEKLSSTDKQRTHIFSSFFYNHLTQMSATRRKSDKLNSSPDQPQKKGKTWAKNVNIFEKDFLIIPINQCNHWFLAIICFPGLISACTQKPLAKTAQSKANENSPSTSKAGLTITPLPLPASKCSSAAKDQSSNTDDQKTDDSGSISTESESCQDEEAAPSSTRDSSYISEKKAKHKKMPCILIFDSLSGPKHEAVIKTLREYLNRVWSMRNPDHVFSKLTIKGHVLEVPQQTNFSDCGIYVLQYVESFFEDPFPYYSDQMPPLPEWFLPEKVSGKRQEIRELIFQLQERHETSSTNDKPPSQQNNTTKDCDEAPIDIVSSTSPLAPVKHQAR